MPSYLDLGLLVIIFISALLAMLRGFTREVLAIASWAAAAVAAIYLYPLVLPYVPKSYVSKEIIREAIAAALVFFVTLLIASLITAKISDMIFEFEGRPARPFARLRIRRLPRPPALRHRFCFLLLARPRKDAAGMGEKRKDETHSPGDRRSTHGDVA